MPLYITLKNYIIKYWLRVCQLQDSMLVKKAYLMIKELDNLGFNIWVTNVRKILTQCKVSHYIYKGCISREDEANCIKEVKEYMYAKFQKDCMQCLQSYPILRTYITFKLDSRF